MHQYRIKGFVLLEATEKKDIKVLRALFAGALKGLVDFSLMKFKRKNRVSYTFEQVKGNKNPEWPYHKFIDESKIKTRRKNVKARRSKS